VPLGRGTSASVPTAVGPAPDVEAELRAALAELSPAGQPVAVLSILKVYGSTFGMPNPGLLPTRREREEQFALVDRAIKDLERRGCTVDGQIAATRSAGRTIAKVARVRQVRYVVMDSPTATGVRKIIEGEITGIVRRRLRDRATLELVGGKS